MPVCRAVYNRLTAIPEATIRRDVPLAQYTRFSIGGPAALLVETANDDSFVQALDAAKSCSVAHVVIGGGTNLVVADAGFDGVVLRYTGRQIVLQDTLVRVQAGAVLQDVVDASIAVGLEGLQTMTGIPGELGGAIYGNAGAYGHSIQEIVELVRWTDGKGIYHFDNGPCQFSYRESIFKRNKDWIVLSADLRFRPGEHSELTRIASEIRTVRDAKYPPTMKCAGSIFKNLMFSQLPPSAQQQVPSKLVREGKVPSAWFLEQADVKGLRVGDIQVATYHANLIYNDGTGTAADLVEAIRECKARVRRQFGFDLEEEVQYVGESCEAPTRPADRPSEGL
jgi:UDP-N-acetylmuramate dehydrogenase